jgi:spore germination cell wall hydrolase CwlJ-like protein
MGQLSSPEPLFEMAEQVREPSFEKTDLSDQSPVVTPDSTEAPTEILSNELTEVPEFKVFNSPDEMSELEILARTIEAEAKGESYEGKIAVGATIANRASSGKYGTGIHGVILRRGQFSPWNRYTGYAGGEQGKDMLNYKASLDSYKAANAILTGNYEDPTDGATHYVNEKVSQPAWLDAMKGRERGTLSIGNHLFGNADANKKYDGKSWIESREKRKTSPRPQLRPEE